MSNNYNWLNNICNNTLVYNDWHDDQVILLNPHNTIERGDEDGYINACDIVGITNDGYCGRITPTWLQLLENLKRFSRFQYDHRNQGLEDLIRIIHSEDVFPPDFKCVYELNNQYYIGTGHHRLTVAKFLDARQIKVQIIHVCQKER